MTLLICSPTSSAREYPAHAARALALIDSLFAAARADSAIGVIEAHLPAARAGADSSLLLALQVRHGRILASADRARPAEPVLTEAVALAEALHDSTLLCEALKWLGVSVDYQGRRVEAGQICTRLLYIARATGQRINEGWAHFGLGWWAEQEGRHDDALESYRRALALFEGTTESSGEIWAWNGMGSIKQRVGAYREARECYQRSMQRAIETGNPNGELRALNNLGTIEFSVGDPAKALEAFQRAYDLQTDRGNLRDAVTPAINVALCLTWLGRFQEAESILDRNLVLCRAENWLDLVPKLVNQLARTKYAQGAFPEAARLYRDLLAQTPSLPLRQRIQLALGLSNSLADMDSSAVALAALDGIALEAGDALVGEQWVHFQGTRARRLLEAGRPREALALLAEIDASWSRLRLTADHTAVLALLGHAYRALGQRDSALAVLESARAAWEAERRIPTNPDWRELRGTLGKYIYIDLTAALTERSTPGGTSPGVAEAFERLQVFKARTLLERMTGPGAEAAPEGTAGAPPTAPGAGSAGTPPALPGGGTPDAGTETIRLTQLEEILRPEEVFLDAYVGDEQSFVFAITHDEAVCVPLPGARLLAERIELYHQIVSDAGACTQGGGRLLYATAVAIDSLLLKDLHGLLAGRTRVFISPDGPLHKIPFGLANLLDPGSGPQDSGAAAGWVRVPSATVLWRIRTASSPGPDAAATRILALAGRRAGDGAALRGAEREVARLARRFQGVDTRLPATGAGAEPDWGALSSYGLLHFAAHASGLDRAPWQSAIELDSDAGTALTARKVAGLRLRAALAVLSSCESARGVILSGEGVAGLTSAFLAAGVPAVVATLWPVDDRVTAGFMRRFYEALAAGRPAGEALADAQAALRRDPRTAAPFYWAGFVLTGDDRVTVTLRPRARAPWGWFAAGAILVATGFAVGMRSRRRVQNR